MKPGLSIVADRQLLEFNKKFFTVFVNIIKESLFNKLKDYVLVCSDLVVYEVFLTSEQYFGSKSLLVITVYPEDTLYPFSLFLPLEEMIEDVFYKNSSGAIGKAVALLDNFQHLISSECEKVLQSHPIINENKQR